MTVKERIASILLIEKIHRLPDYAVRIGLSIQSNDTTNNERNMNDEGGY